MSLDTSEAKFEESKAEIKNIILEKVRLEGELQLKMNYIQASAERHGLNDDDEIKTLALSY